MDDGDLDVDGLDVASTELRRVYAKESRRLLRQKKKDAVEYLRRRADELTAVLGSKLAQRNATNALPWQEVARVFQNELALSMGSNRRLQAQVLAYCQVARDMQRWVAMSAVGPASLPRNASSAAWTSSALIETCPTYQFVVLQGCSISRALAMEWLVQHMYHNTESVLAGFPTAKPHEVEASVTMEITPTRLNAKEFSSAVVPYALDTVINFYETQFRTMWPEPHLIVREATATTSLYHYEDQDVCDDVINDASYWNGLVGVVRTSPDRCVVVFQRVQDDDQFRSHDDIEHHALQWTVLDRVGPRATHAHFYGLRSRVLTPQLATNANALAAFIGVDVEESIEELERSAATHNLAMMQAAQTRLHDAIARMDERQMEKDR